MDPKSDEGIYLDYSVNRRAYTMYNIHAKIMMKSINVVIDEKPEDKDVVEDEDGVSPGRQMS